MLERGGYDAETSLYVSARGGLGAFCRSGLCVSSDIFSILSSFSGLRLFCSGKRLANVEP